MIPRFMRDVSLKAPASPPGLSFCVSAGTEPGDKCGVVVPRDIAVTEGAMWMGPHGHVVHYPVRRGELINIVAHFDSDSWTEESWTRECEGADDDLRRLASPLTPGERELFDYCVEKQFAPRYG